MIARVPLAVPLAALGLFGLLLGLVAGEWAPLRAADVALSGDFRGYGLRRPDVVDAVRVVTDVAATIPFLFAGVAATTLLAARRDRPRALFVGLVTVVVPVLWSLLHWVLHRPRPEDGFVSVDSSGFPSGHTANAAAAGLVAVLLLWPTASRRLRAMVVGAAVLFAVAIGLSRIALLAHWPSDVLGGWLLALAVVPLLARAASRRAAATGRSEGSRAPAGPD